MKIKHLRDGIEINGVSIPYTLLASCGRIPKEQDGLVALIKRDGIHVKSEHHEVILSRDLKAYAKSRIDGDYLTNSSL